MNISSIRSQVKNPQRASVFLDGKYSFSLSLDQLVAEKLKVKAEISEVELKRFKKLSTDGKLKARALEWLISRPHAEREFRDYLVRKKADQDLILAWIEEFRDRDYLNDQRFAQWLVAVRRSRGKSSRAIKFELRNKGITGEVAEEAIASDTAELDALKMIIEKKRRLSRYAADPQKLISYLARQGYSYQLIKEALDDNPDKS